MNNLPKGFNCPSCGVWHDFPAYVYAHWRDTLSHTCKYCEQQTVIVQGKASAVVPPAPAPTKKASKKADKYKFAKRIVRVRRKP